MVLKQTVSLTRDNARVIVANSTPDQEERLKGFKFGDRLPELWHIGFITPNQVTSYYCKKCNKVYETAPTVSVSVAMVGSDLNTSAAYHCGHCNDLIYHGHLPSPEGIPEEFIQFDETGEYRKPTQESVNSLLARLNDRAKEGHGSSIERPSYGSDLEIAKRWAGKIEYDIGPQVEALTNLFRKSYVAKLESGLPNLVAEIKDKAYGFSLVETHGISNYEGEELGQRMDRLLQTIQLTTPSNPEVNGDIIKIFELYWKMHHDEKERLSAEKRTLEERIASEEASLVRTRRMQSDFIQKVNLTGEQVQEARDRPLDTWPLKD